MKLLGHFRSLVEGSEMDFHRSIAGFLDHCSVERQLAECTLQAYSYDLADFGAWLQTQFIDRTFLDYLALSPAELCDSTANPIKTDHLRAYLEHMTERKLSAATIRRRLACLRAFFRFVADRDGTP